VSLPRAIPTRLLEACDREAKACLAQAALGLEADYKAADGSWKVFPYALLEGESAVQYQINIVVTPSSYEQGVGAINMTFLDVNWFFHFPVLIRTFTVGVGANTYLDHVWALRRWLMLGGTWAARISVAMKAAPIEDPDHSGESLGSLIRWEVGDPFVHPKSKGVLVVPVGTTWETRESSTGELV
jgi:hypothetical protein